MAITKIWAVKDDLNRVLNYIKNPDKTKEDMSDGVRVRRKSPKSVSRKQPILVKRKSP